MGTCVSMKILESPKKAYVCDKIHLSNYFIQEMTTKNTSMKMFSQQYYKNGGVMKNVKD